MVPLGALWSPRGGIPARAASLERAIIDATLCSGADGALSSEYLTQSFSPAQPFKMASSAFMPDSGIVLGILGAEAFLSLLFGGLFLYLHRAYDRADLRFWAWAWFCLLAHLACVLADGLLEQAGVPLTRPMRVPVTALYGATSNLAMLFVAFGAVAFNTGSELSARQQRRWIGLAIGVAAASALISGVWTVPPGFRGFFREGLRALIAAGTSFGVAAYTWSYGRNERGVGPVLTRGGLVALGLSQLNYGIQTVAAAVWGRPFWSVVYLGIIDTLVWTLLGVGTVAWLLEQMRARTIASAETEAELARALGRKDARFKEIIEAVQDLILVVDPGGKLVFSGNNNPTITGFTPDEVLGSSIELFIHPDDLAAVRHTMDEVVANPFATRSVVCRVRRKTGGFVTLECIARNRLEVPDIQGIVVTARDITERKRLEEQLLQSQRMESVGRLAGGVAHDFNNLLTVISGNASLALKSLPADAAVKPDLLQIEQAAERAAALTRQLLAFARRQVVEPRVFDVNELVSRVELMLHRLVGQNMALSCRLAPAPGFVRADPGQIEQVVFNLAVNASDAMPHGGRLEVTTGTAHVKEPRVPVAGMAEGAYVTLTVRDTGHGISDEVKSHLFEPFFTTKATGEGTGLGLATSYGIVSQSGGYIGVESEEGQGAMFTVYLPLVNPLRATSSPVAIPALPRGSELILLAEDEETVRQVAVRALQYLGYRVLEASDGESALELFREHKDKIHCVVTDIVMPRLGGVALARQVRALRPGTPVLFTSGYTDQSRIEDAGPQPRLEFLQKPYRLDALAQRVRELLDSAPVATAP